MIMTPIIFLDIDGVVNNSDITKFEGRTGEYAYGVFTSEKYFDSNCVACLNKIIEATGADIVISSSWRILFDKETLSSFFERQGVKGTIIDCTRRDSQGLRGLDIQDWLDRHPEVKSFVILDDVDDMAHLMPYLIHTTYDKGLEEHHVNEAIAMLSVVEDFEDKNK